MTSNPQFCAAVQRPDEEIDLAYAALSYARDAFPDLDPRVYLNQFDEWAANIRSDIAASADPIATLNEFLFRELQFVGNRRFYGDPLNSYLNKVVDRRTGLPITLSIIYIEVARRVDLRVEGIGLPGHFIVRHVDRHGIRYLDPFHQGRLLTVEDCHNLVIDLSNGTLEFKPAMLEPVTPRQILTRTLTNLKNAYVQQEQFALAVPVVERLLDLTADEPAHLRDLGLLHYQLDQYQPALHTLRHYLLLTQAAPDDVIQQVVADIQMKIARLN